jgi:hypothetical protein
MPTSPGLTRAVSISFGQALERSIRGMGQLRQSSGRHAAPPRRVAISRHSCLVRPRWKSWK